MNVLKELHRFESLYLKSASEALLYKARIKELEDTIEELSKELLIRDS